MTSHISLTGSWIQIATGASIVSCEGAIEVAYSDTAPAAGDNGHDLETESDPLQYTGASKTWARARWPGSIAIVSGTGAVASVPPTALVAPQVTRQPSFLQTSPREGDQVDIDFGAASGVPAPTVRSARLTVAGQEVAINAGRAFLPDAGYWQMDVVWTNGTPPDAAVSVSGTVASATTVVQTDFATSATYTPGTGIHILNLWDPMTDAGFRPPQDELLANLRFSLLGAPADIAGVTSANGYLQVDTTVARTKSFVYLVDWDARFGETGGSYSARVDLVVAYPTVMEIGINTKKGGAGVGRAVGPAGTTISSGAGTTWAVTDVAGHARLHFAAGATPALGSYSVTLSTGAVISITVVPGTTVAALTGPDSVDSVYEAAALGEKIIVREGSYDCKYDDTPPVRSIISRSTVPAPVPGQTHIEVTSHTGELVNLCYVQVAHNGQQQPIKFSKLRFLVNPAGTSAGLTEALEIPGATGTVNNAWVDDCEVIGTERITSSTVTMARSGIRFYGGGFRVSNTRILDTHKAIRVNARNVQIENVTIRRVLIDGVFGSIFRDIEIKGLDIYDHLYGIVERPLLSVTASTYTYTNSGGTVVTKNTTTVTFPGDVAEFDISGRAAQIIGANFGVGDRHYTVKRDTLAKSYDPVTNIGSLVLDAPLSALPGPWLGGGYIRCDLPLHGDDIQIGPVGDKWKAGDAYAVGDYVYTTLASGADATYRCTTAHVAGSAIEPDLTKWELVTDLQSNVRISGVRLFRGRGVPQFSDGQGIFGGNPYMPQDNWLIEGLIYFGSMTNGIRLPWARNVTIRSSAVANWLGSSNNAMISRAAVILEGPDTATCAVIDTVANFFSVGAAVQINNLVISPAIDSTAWPAREQDMTLYGTLWSGPMPVAEKSLTPAEVDALGTIRPGGPLDVAYPIGGGRGGSFDWDTLTYVDPRETSVADILLYLGNSAASGRGANAGYSFAPNVFEFSQGGTLVPAGTTYGTGANIDGADTNAQPDQYSPAEAYTRALMAADPSLDAVILVPQTLGSSDLDVHWAIGGPGTTAALARLTAALAAAQAAGYTIRRVVASYMSLSSDLVSTADGSALPNKIAQIDAFVTHLRTQIAPLPVALVVNTGPDASYLAANYNANHGGQLQARRSLGYRIPGARAVDFEALPQVLLGDNLHANTETNRNLIGPALAAAASAAGAALTVKLATRFAGLTFFGALEHSYPQEIPLWDEVTQSVGLTVGGAPRAPSWAKVTAGGKSFYGSTTSLTRVLTCPTPAAIAGPWSLCWSGVINSFPVTAFGVFQNTGTNIRMYYSPGNGWRYGLTSASQLTAPISAAAGAITSLVMTYDGTTVTLFENGLQIGSGPAGAAASAGVLAIGAQAPGTSVTGPLPGVTYHAAIANRVLTPTEIAEYHSVAAAP